MNLQGIGLVPAIVLAIALWQHDAICLVALGLAAIVDFVMKWGWAMPQLSEEEQETLDDVRSERRPAGPAKLAAVPTPSPEPSKER